ncbi:MAG: TMEM175 family protein [Bacteroidetes bacterium]|nr:TMEM175 family protein [Bacteroidota bacterium]
MKSKGEMSTNRLEAFSDGVIAIVITIMVFDLKLQSSSEDFSIDDSIRQLLPNFLSYGVSFIMLALMWVRHHQLFSHVKVADARLLWLNILLLFAMSFVPFGTHLVGIAPLEPQSAVIYSAIFLFSAVSFTLIRSYVSSLSSDRSTRSSNIHKKTIRRNLIAIGIYILSCVVACYMPIVAYILITTIPISYFISTFFYGQISQQAF